MPKISASAFLQTVNFLSLASAFRHQGQSNTAGHGIVRHCSAMDVRRCVSVRKCVTGSKYNTPKVVSLDMIT